MPADQTLPRIAVPKGACDCHLHIYPPGIAMQLGGNVPPRHVTVADYRRVQQRLGLTRCVIVQPTVYGSDNSVTLDAMAEFGANARGVAVAEDGLPAGELERLDGQGMRGLRYHSMPGSASLPWDVLEDTAARIGERGWHLQFSLSFGEGELAALAARFSRLPCDVVFDHIARVRAPVSFESANVRALRGLVAGGRCWVKLSAPYHGSRSGPPHYADMTGIASALVEEAPERMLWASNWPHPTLKGNFPDELDLLGLLGEWAPDSAARERILVSNPERLYGFPPIGAGR